MKPNSNLAPSRPRAFTLVELLVVMSVIAILAALIFPAGAAIKRGATIKKAQAELLQVETAINSYKAKFGHFPPDNVNQCLSNMLYFELLGTVQKGANFETLDGSAQIPVASVQPVFGVGGFVNCTKGGGDESTPAVKFLQGLKPGQFAELTPGFRLLTCSVGWPVERTDAPLAGFAGVNPWRYVSTNPTNNQGGFDLWVDIFVGGKTNRISNWTKQPQINP